MGRKRLFECPVTFRIGKEQYKKIMKDTKRNGNVGNVLRRILDEHYLFKYRIRNNLTGFYNLVSGGMIMNKKIIGVLGIIAIAGMLFGLGMQPVVYQAPIEQHSYLDGIISVHKNGVLIDRHHNVLMNVGANGIRDYLTTDNFGPAIDYIALGNDTDAVEAADTDLDQEIAECGFTRADAAAKLAIQGTGNWSYDHTFTSTGCPGITINASAMFNATAGATDVMFWGSTFTSTNLEVDDTLKITWNVSVAGA